MRIPAGKQVRIFKGGSSIVGDIPLILEEDVTMNLNSNFSALVENPGSTLLDVIGGVSRDYLGLGFSSQNTFQGFQIWKGTDPLSLNLVFHFYIGIKDMFDAKTEVYDPMIQLMSIPLPSTGGVLGQASLVPPGPSVASVLINDDVTRGHKFSLEIGKLLRIPNIVISKAEPTWGKEVDDQGFPITASISLDIQSINIATVEMITNSANSDSAMFETFLKNFNY